MNSRSASGIGVSYDMSNNMMLKTINIIVVLAYLAGAYYFWTDTKEFLETSEITYGEIVRFNESVRDGTIHYTAVVRFSTASGREVEFWSNTSSSNPS